MLENPRNRLRSQSSSPRGSDPIVTLQKLQGWVGPPLSKTSERFKVQSALQRRRSFASLAL